VPRVSFFFGVAVFFCYNDHEPPHFHAEYGGNEATFAIETLECLAGELPRRVRALVIEWASLHRKELRIDWHRARDGLPMIPIEPLD